MIWTEADQYFYQDVHQLLSAHFINEKQEVELMINTLSSEASWFQLQDRVLIWQTEH